MAENFSCVLPRADHLGDRRRLSPSGKGNPLPGQADGRRRAAACTDEGYRDGGERPIRDDLSESARPTHRVESWRPFYNPNDPTTEVTARHRWC